ncbi:MAG: hypothetical protein ACE5Q7_04155 [Candidatus Nitrosomaritimum yanchengensis]
MEENSLEQEKKHFTPEKGFNLVGIYYFDNTDGQLYLIENFEMYQDALNAKKNRKKPEEYLILYKGPGGEYLSR